MKYTNKNIFFEPVSEELDSSDSQSISTEAHLTKALTLISEIFKDKTDKFGRPVLLHSIAVGMMGRTNDETLAGFLHDVLEDSDITIETLYDMFPRTIVNTVKLLTRDIKVPYNTYIKEIAESNDKLALAVKMNDLRHNMMRASADDLFSLTSRYKNAIEVISAV